MSRKDDIYSRKHAYEKLKTADEEDHDGAVDAESDKYAKKSNAGARDAARIFRAEFESENETPTYTSTSCWEPPVRAKRFPVK